MNCWGRAFAEAQTALNDLRRLYAIGKLTVPIDGIVSRVIADQGAVVRAGDPLIEVYGDKHFVLAYIPTGALYSVQPGEHVLIDTGWRTSEGVIVRVEPFAAALPGSFSVPLPQLNATGNPGGVLVSRGLYLLCSPKSRFARQTSFRVG